MCYALFELLDEAGKAAAVAPAPPPPKPRPTVVREVDGLKLLLSSNNKTGYSNVVEVRPGQFYVKKKLDEVAGSKKQKMFGTMQPTVREAARVLAPGGRRTRTSCPRSRD